MLGSDFLFEEINNNNNFKKMTDRGKCLSLPHTGNGFVNKVKVHVTPKYFIRLNKSLHLFQMHSAVLN